MTTEQRIACLSRLVQGSPCGEKWKAQIVSAIHILLAVGQLATITAFLFSSHGDFWTKLDGHAIVSSVLTTHLALQAAIVMYRASSGSRP